MWSIFGRRAVQPASGQVVNHKTYYDRIDELSKNVGLEGIDDNDTPVESVIKILEALEKRTRETP